MIQVLTESLDSRLALVMSSCPSSASWCLTRAIFETKVVGAPSFDEAGDDDGDHKKIPYMAIHGRLTGWCMDCFNWLIISSNAYQVETQESFVPDYRCHVVAMIQQQHGNDDDDVNPDTNVLLLLDGGTE
mmetsp:Transcript_21070/g.34874  ORF Transcript_21070/g.34874 Transcript_21070/m.34874 type:complete len:130 (-) Transcript_21070:388-777(-)|eukprot:CAMPEP_0119023810 /NCGR_PEP_ID=MMETSP1176-20130426/30684_1 /TAXON_ID=265551 /ORGANISM="Synedropsis recta cf, Strain CCMP1620" /LENGTH=129 /DNA_ID=CAMNT_0006978947 /DNA_START=418 /DNA_END=807 /DNA_ORIENTATION=+